MLDPGNTGGDLRRCHLGFAWRFVAHIYAVGNLAWYCLSFLKGFAIGIWIVHFRFYSFLRVQNLEPLPCESLDCGFILIVTGAHTLFPSHG